MTGQPYEWALLAAAGALGGYVVLEAAAYAWRRLRG